MPSPTLIQKRALAALSKNLKEAERAYAQAYNSYSVAIRHPYVGPNHFITQATAKRWGEAQVKAIKARNLLKQLERKLGLSGNNNYAALGLNARRQAAARKIQAAYRRHRTPKRVSPKRSPYTPRSMRRIPRTNLN